jgi:pheromone shutdown protein TraB
MDELKTINELKTKYPMSYEILVSSRNLFIENKILRLIKNNPNKKILCFIGKGHKLNLE